MNGDRLDQAHPCPHVIGFTVKGATAAEIEGLACQEAARFFGLLVGDVIPDWLDIEIASEERVDRNVAGDKVFSIYSATVTARRDWQKWTEWLESL